MVCHIRVPTPPVRGYRPLFGFRSPSPEYTRPYRHANGRPCKPCEDMQRILWKKDQCPWRTAEYIALEEAETNLRYELNRVHDCLGVFPSEIMSLIFEFSCDEDPGEAQLVLTSVCINWRAIARHTPALWNRIPIHGWNSSRRTVSSWIRRAKDLPISFVMMGHPDHHSGPAFEAKHRAIRLLLAHNTVIRGLDCTAIPFVPRMLFKDGLVESTTWPNLTHITTEGWEVPYVLDLLARCPQATHVVLWRLKAGLVSPPSLMHHYLQSLTMAFDIGGFPEELLWYLSAPALTTLKVSFGSCDICPVSVLDDFLDRSGCSLTTLRLGDAEFDIADLTTLLRRQSSLRVLIMGMGPFYHSNHSQNKRPIIDELLGLLLTNSGGEVEVDKQHTTSSFLPRLERLEFTGLQTFSLTLLGAVYVAHSEVASDDGISRGPEPVPSLHGYRPLKHIKVEIRQNFEFDRDRDQDWKYFPPPAAFYKRNGCVLESQLALSAFFPRTASRKDRRRPTDSEFR